MAYSDFTLMQQSGFSQCVVTHEDLANPIDTNVYGSFGRRARYDFNSVLTQWRYNSPSIHQMTSTNVEFQALMRLEVKDPLAGGRATLFAKSSSIAPSQWGYRFGLYRANGVNNPGAAPLLFQYHDGTEITLETLSSNTWYNIRLRIFPSPGVGDNIYIHRESSVGSGNWIQVHNVFLPVADARYSPWGDANYPSWGFWLTGDRWSADFGTNGMLDQIRIRKRS